MSGTVLSTSERIKRARRMEQAVAAATHPDPAQRITAYAAAQRFKVSQSAISQNRDYRAWKDNQPRGENAL